MRLQLLVILFISWVLWIKICILGCLMFGMPILLFRSCTESFYMLKELYLESRDLHIIKFCAYPVNILIHKSLKKLAAYRDYNIKNLCVTDMNASPLVIN